MKPELNPLLEDIKENLRLIDERHSSARWGDFKPIYTNGTAVHEAIMLRRHSILEDIIIYIDKQYLIIDNDHSYLSIDLADPDLGDTESVIFGLMMLKQSRINPQGIEHVAIRR